VALCERPSERWKRWIIAEPFAALLVSFSAMWLMRYVDPRFSWLLEASSALLAVTFYVQSYLILREVRRGNGRPRDPGNWLSHPEWVGPARHDAEACSVQILCFSTLSCRAQASAWDRA